MKAALNEDMIIGFSGDTEIGVLPSGVGLERLRWDGEKVVDLATLDEIWVRERNGTFSLHAIEVPGSQKIVMKYTDRRRLTVDEGVISLRTEQAMEAIKQLEKDRIIENRSLKTEALSFVSGLTYSQIDDHIDNVFGNLNVAQKNSLKRLYKIVLFLAKSRLSSGG